MHRSIEESTGQPSGQRKELVSYGHDDFDWNTSILERPHLHVLHRKMHPICPAFCLGLGLVNLITNTTLTLYRRGSDHCVVVLSEKEEAEKITWLGLGMSMNEVEQITVASTRKILVIEYPLLMHMRWVGALHQRVSPTTPSSSQSGSYFDEDRVCERVCESLFGWR